MAGVKELRLRIKSVGNIKQITRAMEMVATTKLRRFQDRAIASRPYTREIGGLIGRLASMLGERLADRPLFRQGEGNKTLVVLVSSDRGLCGAYNSNLFRELENWRGERPQNELAFFVWGRKGYQYLSKRGYTIERYLTEPSLEKIDYRAAAVAARMICQEYLKGSFNGVWICATRFESMIKYVPLVSRFLPIDGKDLAGEQVPASDVILEPDPVTIFDLLVPRYLETRIFNGLLEALTSEYASRRVAMKNATDAASDMQKTLRGIYNRKRQENITKELLDIVGGAEAVR